MSELNFVIHDNGHSILSPSGWGTWSKCTGSMVGLNAHRKVATDNIASVEGTTGHTLLELAILTWTCPTLINYPMLDHMLDDVIKWRDKIVNNLNNTNEVVLFAQECFKQISTGDYTDEMRIEIKKCYDRIKAYKDDGWVVLAESKVSLFAYFGHHHSDGSSDVIMYKAGRIIVVDLKYGKGIEVSPESNGQLSLYGGGAIASIYTETGQMFEDIELVIMQPRINNGVWKSWKWHYSGDDGLYAFLQDAKVKSNNALEALQGGKVHYEPSEKSCMWCHRKRDCKARAEHSHNATMEAFALAGIVEDSLDRPNAISNEQLSQILDRTPFIISFLSDMVEEAEKRALNGQIIPRRKLVKGRASRKWTNEDHVITVLGASGLRPDEYMVTVVKSPAQMDKVKMDDLQKQLIKSAVTKKFGRDTLVSSNDRREAVVKNSVQAFEQANIGNK